MLVRIIIIIFLLLIMYCLGSGLYFLVRETDDDNDRKRVVKALTWRITLSFILFLSLFLAYGFGWIQPHGIGM